MKKLIALEAIRGMAALYVVIHHAQLLPNSGLGRILYFGQEAVIIFFLLSGFVIALSTKNKSITAKQYITSRAVRIYPIFLLSILLAYMFSGFPTLDSTTWINLFGNIFMLQDISALKEGVWFDTMFGNSPAWSLSYEWWFYLLFIPLGLNRTHPNNKAAAAISVIGWISYQIHPNQIGLVLGYFSIWWAGTSLAHEFKENSSITISSQKNALFLLTTMFLLWSIPAAIKLIAQEPTSIGISPLLQARHHAAALFFFISFILFHKRLLESKNKFILLFSKIAPISYALYLTHKPILSLAESLAPNNPPIKLLLTLLICSAISWLLEVPMQRAISRHFFRGRA